MSVRILAACCSPPILVGEPLLLFFGFLLFLDDKSDFEITQISVHVSFRSFAYDSTHQWGKEQLEAKWKRSIATQTEHNNSKSFTEKVFKNWKRRRMRWIWKLKQASRDNNVLEMWTTYIVSRCTHLEKKYSQRKKKTSRKNAMNSFQYSCATMRKDNNVHNNNQM